ncbi:MAG: HTTM domain-containing protein [Myxococcota bacterium]
MKQLWQRYVSFWNETEAPETLGAVRITFGLALLANILEQLLHTDVLELYADPSAGGIFSGTSGSWSSIFSYLPATAEVVYGVAVVHLLGALLLTVGLFSRLSALLALVTYHSLAGRMYMYRFDADTVYLVFLWLFVLAPSGSWGSLDARWRGTAAALIPAWPRRLMIAQLTIIYVRTGLIKMGSTWSFSDGWSALYYALNLPGLARWPGDWVVMVYPLSQVATFVAKWWEITFLIVPLSLYFQRTPSHHLLRRVLAWQGWRPLYLGVGMLMHLSLILVMNLGLFPIVMMAVYPCLARPEEVRRLLQRVMPSQPS